MWLCNGLVFLPDEDGGQEDILNGCDYGNVKGWGSTVPGSGTLNLDASGNLAGSVTLQLPSSPTGILTKLGGPTGSNSNPSALCPPTPTAIAKAGSAACS